MDIEIALLHWSYFREIDSFDFTKPRPPWSNDNEPKNLVFGQSSVIRKKFRVFFGPMFWYIYKYNLVVGQS